MGIFKEFEIRRKNFEHYAALGKFETFEKHLNQGGISSHPNRSVGECRYVSNLPLI